MRGKQKQTHNSYNSCNAYSYDSYDSHDSYNYTSPPAQVSGGQSAPISKMAYE